MTTWAALITDLVPRADAFSPARERLHDRASAHSDAGLGERAQHVVKQGVDHLFGHRLLAWQVKSRRQFFGDPKANRIRHGPPTAVALVGDGERRLHDDAAAPFDVKLTA